MARGWHCTKLSLLSALLRCFSGTCLCFCSFLFVVLLLLLCFSFALVGALVDVHLIFFCPADHVPDWQPRILLGMVEARSVNVKKTTVFLVFLAYEGSMHYY